ncbi:MAG: hypothetical protein HC819_07000 [Cyclobacteriaceae bacterium]|nr:hypothetical protein [Cyclobacteriaceae bacterium]
MLNLDKVIEHLTKFLELKIQIYELKIKSQMVDIISNFAILGLIVSFGMFLLLFLSLALGFYLNMVLHSPFMGFLCVSLIYLAICIILLVFKGRIIKNRLFQAFFSDTLSSDNDGE